MWHALEEIEHKGVAFDVYEAVGGGYLRRAVAMVWVTILFALTLGFIRIYLHWSVSRTRHAISHSRERPTLPFVRGRAFAKLPCKQRQAAKPLYYVLCHRLPRHLALFVLLRTSGQARPCTVRFQHCMVDL